MTDPRPAVAIIANSHTPYRAHLHRRIARELTAIRLFSVFTHDQSNSPWAASNDSEINPVSFGAGESSNDQAKLKFACREWRKGGRVIKWLCENNIKAVVMFGYNDAGRIRVIRWCRKAGVPCFLFGDSNIRGDRTGGLKGWVKKQVVGRVVKWCRGVMPCGTLGQAYFEKYGARPENVFFFPYEPDYELAPSITAEELAQARKRFGLPEGRRRIIYSGRLIDIKRVDLLIDTFVSIANLRSEWDLVIVGDGALRRSLEARVPAALKERVQWTGFLDDQRTVTAIYRCGDVLVLPSDYEPWAVVINEAAAARLAIVSSDVVGASAELVREGVNGATFRAGDLVGLTAALRQVTDTAVIDRLKAGSATVLSDWRRRGDPVRGLRRALESTGVLPLADNS